MTQPNRSARAKPRSSNPVRRGWLAGVAGVAALAGPAAAEPTTSTGYDKGFFIRSDGDKGSFEVVIGARVQTLLALTSAEDADGRETDAAFSIHRARLTLDGHAYSERIGYKLQVDVGRGFVTLKDAYVDVAAADGLRVRAGQWKRPFSRQHITSSGRLELVDRAITDKAFDAGRDVGVALHNNYEKSPALEWAVGIYNGTGERSVFRPTIDPMTGAVTGGSFTNVPSAMRPAGVARVGYNHGGIKGYSEADLEGGPLRFATGLSVWLEGDADDDDRTRHQAEIDALVKVEGLSVSGAVYAQTAGADLALLGAHAGLGYVLGEGTSRWLPAARYAVLIPQGDGAADPTHEITVGVGWLHRGHDAKVHLDVGTQLAPGGGVADHLTARVLGQLTF